MINDHYCRRASKLLGSFNDIGQKFYVHCHHDRTSDAKVVYELEPRCQRIHTTVLLVTMVSSHHLAGYDSPLTRNILQTTKSHVL
jgi:hypothetical protein